VSCGKTLVILDGGIEGCIWDAAHNWAKECDEHYLVCVCSKWNIENDGVKFCVPGWYGYEYDDAIRSEIFWESVYSVFEDFDYKKRGIAARIQKRKKLVEAKHMMAGTCALWMFGYGRKEIVADIDATISKMKRLQVREPGDAVLVSSEIQFEILSLGGLTGVIKPMGYLSRYLSKKIGLKSSRRVISKMIDMISRF
jgi:hypothetical protein